MEKDEVEGNFMYNGINDKVTLDYIYRFILSSNFKWVNKVIKINIINEC